MPEQIPAINTHVCTVAATAETNPQKILQKDGRPVICHRQAALIIPRSTPEGVVYDVQPIPCSTDCGKANIFEFEENHYWQQDCDTVKIQFRLEQAEKKANEDKEQFSGSAFDKRK